MNSKLNKTLQNGFTVKWLDHEHYQTTSSGVLNLLSFHSLCNAITVDEL